MRKCDSHLITSILSVLVAMDPEVILQFFALEHYILFSSAMLLKSVLCCEKKNQEKVTISKHELIMISLLRTSI